MDICKLCWQFISYHLQITVLKHKKGRVSGSTRQYHRSLLGLTGLPYFRWQHIFLYSIKCLYSLRVRVDGSRKICAILDDSYYWDAINLIRSNCTVPRRQGLGYDETKRKLFPHAILVFLESSFAYFLGETQAYSYLMKANT